MPAINVKSKLQPASQARGPQVTQTFKPVVDKSPWVH